MSSMTIVVDHDSMKTSAQKVSDLSEDMDSQADTLKSASESLLGAWEGEGHDAFSAASSTLEKFVRATSDLLDGESKAYRTLG
ncbi:MAG: WXG100 family type VII secretion target [Olsenella sp.]|jgi:WXG100 family type VII secretion target|nr:WXG100 family type VII secretion target [Olsenella sp.]